MDGRQASEPYNRCALAEHQKSEKRAESLPYFQEQARAAAQLQPVLFGQPATVRVGHWTGKVRQVYAEKRLAAPALH